MNSASRFAAARSRRDIPIQRRYPTTPPYSGAVNTEWVRGDLATNPPWVVWPSSSMTTFKKREAPASSRNLLSTGREGRKATTDPGAEHDVGEHLQGDTTLGVKSADGFR